MGVVDDRCENSLSKVHGGIVARGKVSTMEYVGMYDEVDVYDAELKVEEDDEGYENPPSQVGKKYSQWKKEIVLWQYLTELDKCQQGMAVALSLEGEARKVAVTLGKEKLMADNGIESIIKELDKLFEGSTVNKLQSENTTKMHNF